MPCKYAMTKDVITATPDEPVASVLKKMQRGFYRTFPIIDSKIFI